MSRKAEGRRNEWSMMLNAAEKSYKREITLQYLGRHIRSGVPYNNDGLHRKI